MVLQLILRTEHKGPSFVKTTEGKAEKYMKNFLKSFLSIYLQKETVTRAQVEAKKFSEEVRGQFVALSKKGLSIPVFTL